MNSIGRSVVVRTLRFELHIVLLSLSVGFAATSNYCPVGQYLDHSSCVNCTSCHVPNDIIISPCNGRRDTVCGSITELKSNRNKKPQLPIKNEKQKKSPSTENGNTFYETPLTYHFMRTGPKNKTKKNNDAATVFEEGNEGPPYSIRVSNSSTEWSSPKSFDKNGKHIKKDLSSAGENQTSKPSDSSNLPLMKKQLKSKKTEDEPLKEQNKWIPIIKADFANHRISVEAEPTPPSQMNSVSLDKKPSLIPNVGSHKIRNKIELFDSDEDDYDASRKPDQNDLADEDDDDIDYENDDEDEDNNDEENDASEDDEDFDPPFSTDELRTSEKPFGVQDTLLTNVDGADADDTAEGIARNKYEVNVEPYIDGSNWQLLVLVSAASACFLFFVVLNAYLCIYMKKWRYMKQDFEAGVEDLSVRINLMQYAGFEADESNNIRNYITQLKGGKSSTEKMQKSIL